MGGTKSGVRASEGIGALLLPASDLSIWFWEPTSSFCFPIRLAGRLLQRFYQAQNPGAIAIEF